RADRACCRGRTPRSRPSRNCGGRVLRKAACSCGDECTVCPLSARVAGAYLNCTVVPLLPVNSTVAKPVAVRPLLPQSLWSDSSNLTLRVHRIVEPPQETF